MKDLLQLLRDGKNTVVAALPDNPILVYGAGSKGKEVAAFLVDRGYDVRGFADAAASGRDSWRHLQIMTLPEWQRDHLVELSTIVVGIHNHHVDMAVLINDLCRFNVSRIVNPVEFQALFSGEFPGAYWLADPSVYWGQESQLIRLKALLSDRYSRDLLHRIVEFRLTGRYDVLPPPTPLEQYCPADLPRWPDPLRFIDGGAFDGDTLRQLRRYGYEFEQIVAFEPDLENFARLSRCVENLGGGICLPCGLAQTSRQARFASGGTGSSRITDEGCQMIQCVSLDEALPGFRPHLIKMDIEGSEPDALQGAARTIVTHRPALAISVYHHPAHLWEIPLLIDNWGLDYSFYLRMHGHSSFDLVLYAIPQ